LLVFIGIVRRFNGMPRFLQQQRTDVCRHIRGFLRLRSWTHWTQGMGMRLVRSFAGWCTLRSPRQWVRPCRMLLRQYLSRSICRSRAVHIGRNVVSR